MTGSMFLYIVLHQFAIVLFIYSFVFFNAANAFEEVHGRTISTSLVPCIAHSKFKFDFAVF